MTRRTDREERHPTRRLQAARERGAATLEIAVLFPVVLAITFGVIEISLWYHARDVALAAAEEGVRVATADGSSVSAGVGEASTFAARAGADGILTGVAVTSASNATDVTITVSGDALTLFTGWTGLRVSQTASGPIEQFTGPG
jgi:Flp pilus assembly protein TadG